MTRLSSRFVYDLLEVAEELAGGTGAHGFRQASMRRAVSTAYYAVFHALCYVCADGLVCWSAKPELLEPIYRSVDHGTARRILTGEAARRISPALLRLGDVFANLQKQRHGADYLPPRIVLNGRGETLALIAQAREAVELIETLDSDARRTLAVLLIAKPRQF